MIFSKKQKKLFKGTLFYLLIAAISFYAVFPFYYALVTSFQKGSDIFRVFYFPKSISFENYLSVLNSGYFIQNSFNSIFVAIAVVLFSLMLGVFGAFALGRLRFKGRMVILLMILATSMFPQMAVLSGLFELVTVFGLFNSLWSLIISYMIFLIPFTVWILTTFMKDVPDELERAAKIDGAGTLKIIFKVMLPLLWPAMVSVGLLSFIAAWNELLFALTFISSDSQRTVPVAITLISGASQYEIPWGNIMAASMIVTVPLVILVLIFQNKIVSGLTAGAVKG